MRRHLSTSTDIHDFLRSELKLRSSLSNDYSIDHFAADLGISLTNLKRILFGIGGISEETTSLLVQSLELTPEEAEVFLKFKSASKRRLRPGS